MSQQKRVVMLKMRVPERNISKFYEMTYLEGSPKFTVRYGRIGTRGMLASYPQSKWTNILSAKLSKGYVKVSDSIANLEPLAEKVKVVINKEADSYQSELEQWCKEQLRNIEE